jgi:ATP-dependent Clp protease adaptor protein ClpS
MPTQTKTAPERKVIERPDEQTAPEPLYRVIIHNDNVTTMDFVIKVLVKIFFLNAPEAETVMYAAHTKGSAYVQTLPKTEAQKRINAAHFAAGMVGFPLRFTMEPE